MVEIEVPEDMVTSETMTPSDLISSTAKGVSSSAVPSELFMSSTAPSESTEASSTPKELITTADITQASTISEKTMTTSENAVKETSPSLSTTSVSAGSSAVSPRVTTPSQRSTSEFSRAVSGQPPSESTPLSIGKEFPGSSVTTATPKEHVSSAAPEIDVLDRSTLTTPMLTVTEVAATSQRSLPSEKFNATTEEPKTFPTASTSERDAEPTGTPKSSISPSEVGPSSTTLSTTVI
ncbi:unnamed protein product, partial [Strongylus vulgaris]